MNYFQKVIDIRSTSDPLIAIEVIKEGVSIKGYNMWLLFCSAVLASIGLDTNSAAVIIGAMLISPLMSPILGIGLSFGIHDKTLLGRSLKNFAAAIVLTLTASVLYFLVSPFAYPTAEIEARTYPTLLDVGVALFGGIAGIVSTSRKGVSNALPGVAIATALMPPLCTAGYGLATLQWAYFGGAFYLFFINAVFISLATFIIVKYLKFPTKEYATRRQRNSYSILFGILTTIVTIPSIYFLYTVYQKEQTRWKINELVLSPIQAKGNEILKWELANKDSVTWIKVYHSGSPLGDSLQQDIQSSLTANKLDKYELKTLRINMTKEEVNELSTDVSKRMFEQLQLQQLANEEKPADTLSYTQIFKETKIAFPFLDTIYNGWLTVPDTLGRIDTLPIVFYKASRRVNRTQQNQIADYFKVRFSKDSVVIVEK